MVCLYGFGQPFPHELPFRVELGLDVTSLHGIGARSKLSYLYMVSEPGPSPFGPKVKKV